MSVWLTIPSARPAEEAEKVLTLWRRQGYRLAIVRDQVDLNPTLDADLTFFSRPIWGGYPGYAIATNYAIQQAMAEDPGAQFFVCGGDDVEPDLNHTAQEIADECSMHFNTGIHEWGGCQRGGSPSEIETYEWVRHCKKCGMEDTCEDPLPGCPSTFGIMQPTGDRYAGGSIDRICGSPWIGREFARRMYGGRGPFFEGYRHMFSDQELQEVALKMGVLWQRRDLIHLHRHFMRQDENDLHSDAQRKPTPAHLVQWNTAEHWNESKALFERRKAEGFPGHEPNRMKDYSQFGEQVAVLAAFDQVACRKTLLDIGAYHATDKSNSRALIEMGWSAVLIEPSPGPLLGLVKEYGNTERVQVIGACVALEPGLVKLHVTDDAVSTSDEANYQTWREKGGFYGTLLSPAITLEQISNQFGGFDFCNIDAEGISVDLFLRMMDLGWEPHCICLEYDNRLAETLARATERGYISTFCNGTNVVLVRR